MKMRKLINSKIAALFALTLLGAVLLGSCQTGTNQNQGAGGRPAVRIASNLPMTGELAIYGTTIRDGALMALEDIEKADPNGPKLNFDWQDNGGEGKNAVSVLQKQYLEPPNIYISGVTPQTFAIRDQIAAKGTPHFEYFFFPYLNTKGQNEFRTWVSYKLSPTVILPYAEVKNARRVAIAYNQTESAERMFSELVVPKMKEKGVEVLAEPFQFGKKDFKDVAVKFRDFKPDLIIFDGFQDDMVGLVRALRPLNLITDGNTVANYDMMDAATILSPQEMEGIRVVAPLFATRSNQEKMKAWRDRFRAKYNKEAIYTNAYAYDMAQIINDAAKRLKLPATSQQWVEALRATNIEGVTGPLKFDNSGDLVTPIELGVYRNGKLVPNEQAAAAAAGR